ncbi:uncharacterized protein LOC123317039 [Coccinella septempunctata]|uniref:uncharacterized protein LOC123317039 n=1 Tax=Coccinella septempunctata TaxID=41139 RepID=UPI001D079D20|nr:uncharacterized protein LOC123317039 [Coccinella septempunctata]
MNANTKSDEKYPLLYLIVDKDDGGSSNNRKFFDRRTGITSGASNILEQWPGYLSTCWVSSLVFILAILSMFVLLMTALSTYKFHRIPRCIAGENPMLDNSTIHLVHGTDPWNQQQLDMVEKVIQVFPNHRIHLMLIKRQTYSNVFEEVPISIPTDKPSTPSPTAQTASSRKLLRLFDDPIEKTNSGLFGKDDMAGDLNSEPLLGWPFFDPRDFINTFLKRSMRKPILKSRSTTVKPFKVTSIAALLLRYPAIFVETLTFEEAFEKSPLFLTWHHLNDETKIFAIRVLQLWQYGGLSFDLVRTKNMSEAYSPTTENILVTTDNGAIENSTLSKEVNKDIQDKENDESNTYVDSLLYLGYSNFQMIPGGIVTLAENGCHMETKSACHSFFGEILFNLKYASRLTTPEDIIKGALKYFLKPPHKSYKRP